MTPRSATIQQNQVLPPGQDYALLRAEGLAHLQRLSGETWTDYNLHDPGITLLEALCYTLTDLSSRASQPIPELLAPAATEAAGTTFVPAHRAFANHPVTCQDYQKLVLDRFYQQVKNVWVSPLRPAEGQPAASGHYQVALELSAPTQRTAQEQEALCTAVGAVLNQHRNLGEQFERPTLLQPRRVTVGGSLDLLPGQQPEHVLANVLIALAQALAPYPVSDSLAKLRAQGLATEDIFAGPVMQHRLLLESSFPGRRQYLGLSDLLQQVQQVAGIRHLGAFQLYYTDTKGQAAETSHLAVADHEIPQLDVPATLQHLVVSQLGVPVLVNHTFVQQRFERWLHTAALNPGGPTAQRPDRLRFADQPGTYLGLGRYDSVQNLLPALYGVCEDGPPPVAVNEGDIGLAQQAAIMQLKGYLLHFEQVMADFCAQLETVGQFFSPTSPSHPKVLASTALYDVPFVAPLLAGTGVSPGEAWGRDPAAEARWQAYQADHTNAYLQALRPTAEQRPRQLDQRYAVLSHLLARFGYAVQLQVPFGTKDEQGPEGLLHAYEQLLANLDTATYHRAAARLPLAAEARPTDAPESDSELANVAESGLEFFLFLLTGLPSIARCWWRQEPLAALEAQPPEPTPARQAAQAAKRVRLSLLDHLVLKPLPTAPPADPPIDADFFHCQVTVFLPAYAPAYDLRGTSAADRTRANEARAYVEDLIYEYAPAHLLVTTRWLSYEQLREWEALYAQLQPASGLLNATGQPDEQSLAGLQSQVVEFLRHLSLLPSS